MIVRYITTLLRPDTSGCQCWRETCVGSRHRYIHGAGDSFHGKSPAKRGVSASFVMYTRKLAFPLLTKGLSLSIHKKYNELPKNRVNLSPMVLDSFTTMNQTRNANK